MQGIVDIVKQQTAEARIAAQKQGDAVESKRLQSVQRRTSKEVMQQVPATCRVCMLNSLSHMVPQMQLEMSPGSTRSNPLWFCAPQCDCVKAMQFESVRSDSKHAGYITPCTWLCESEVLQQLVIELTTRAFAILKLAGQCVWLQGRHL